MSDTSDRAHGRDVTEAELEVLRSLWEQGPSTIRELADRLYAGGTASQYATVQKLLDRLEEKSFVARTRAGRQNVFTAQVERQHLVARRLRRTAEQLCEGSLTPLLTHLVAAGDLSRDEIGELQRLVAELAPEGGDE